jgi:eukaryotic-like serine/threonine-protein kinase
MADADEERNPLDVVAEEFGQRCRRGENPAISEYIEKYPHLADEIMSLLPAVAMMEKLKQKKQTRRQTRIKPPPSLNNYQIVRETGRSPLGVVCEARDGEQRVTLTILPKELSAGQLAQVERDSAAATRLIHPNIVPVLGTGQTAKFHYHVMTQVKGSGMRAVLQALRARTARIEITEMLLLVGRPPQPRFWQWVSRTGALLADALSYAHERQLSHGNVQPQSVIFDANGVPHFLNFGLAALNGNSSAPDAATDINGLAATLYEMLTLKTPTADASEQPGIPIRLQRTVLKGLRVSSDGGYKSAKAFVEDLLAAR